MTKIRHIAWGVREYIAEPAEYDYARDDEIVAMDQVHLTNTPEDGFLPRQLTNILTQTQGVCKPFTLKQLKDLVAARGFLQVMCNWIEPDQVEDDGIRGRVALIQQLLSEIWERLE